MTSKTLPLANETDANNTRKLKNYFHSHVPLTDTLELTVTLFK